MTIHTSGVEIAKLDNENMTKVQPLPIASTAYWTAATKPAPTRHRPMLSAAVTDAARPGGRSTRMGGLGGGV